MVETPKLDELAENISEGMELGTYITEEFLSSHTGREIVARRFQRMENALMEIREILKTVRQKSLP